MRYLHDLGSLFGGGGGGGSRARDLDLLKPPGVDPKKAKEREAALRGNEDALALFDVQKRGFGASEAGSVRSTTPLAAVRGETAAVAGRAERPGETAAPVGPPTGPETVPVPPLSEVVTPAPGPRAAPRPRAEPQIDPAAIRRTGGQVIVERVPGGRTRTRRAVTTEDIFRAGRFIR